LENAQQTEPQHGTSQHPEFPVPPPPPQQNCPAAQQLPLQQLPPLPHVVPSAFSVSEQTPVEGSHVPATWHWLEATQMTGLLPTQIPAWQVDVWVQRLESKQVVPSVFCGLEQVPVAGSHVPALWHWSWAKQVTGLPTQAPFWQVSFWVQRLPSLQAVPSVFFGLVHCPVAGSQVPAVWH
jgi:hypothetical protein